MSQYNKSEKKAKIWADIDDLRSEVSNNPKIRLRVQVEIFETLDKAVELLEKNGSDVSLHQAASQVEIARKRALQAKSQGQLFPWLPILIGFYLFAVLILTTCLMIANSSDLFKANTVWEYIVLGAVLWGAIGSATDGLRELHTRVARQELDFNRLAWYLTHPVIGAALGGVLVFVVYGGLSAFEIGNLPAQNDGTMSYNPALVYALAALAGFAQRQVIQYLRETLANILHIKKDEPEEGG